MTHTFENMIKVTGVNPDYLYPFSGVCNTCHIRTGFGYTICHHCNQLLDKIEFGIYYTYGRFGVMVAYKDGQYQVTHRLSFSEKFWFKKKE